MGLAKDEESIELAAGPLAMTFEPSAAMLRYVRIGEAELVGNVDGVVRFEFRGEAGSAFRRNRIGLCVLHPIKECVGRRCVIGHGDGTTGESLFPTWISPHQPFQNVRSMTHDAAGHFRVKVDFEGEIFETEDQRNWTDASFKTYGTPLDLPFPVEVPRGTRIEQSVTITPVGRVAPISSPGRSRRTDGEVRVIVDWQRRRAPPPIGLSMATGGRPLTEATVDRLREIRPAHLRVDVRLDRWDWQADLQDAITLAERIDCNLEIATFSRDAVDAAWTRCLTHLQDAGRRIARWLVFHPTAKSTPDDLARAAAASIRESFASTAVVVGTDAYFAELNRDRPEVPDGCSVCYSINPQVHAFDKRSLRETIEAHRWTVDSAKRLFGRPVVISPITLNDRDGRELGWTVNAESLAAEFGVPAVDDDVAETLHGESLDFVDVVTNVESHGEHVGLAAAHRLPVICQKPMAHSLDAARDMVRQTSRAGVELLIHENWRWQAPLRRLKELLDTGELVCQTRRMREDIAGEDVATVMMRIASGATVTCNMSYASRWELDRFPQTMVAVEGTEGGVTLGVDYELRVFGRDGVKHETVALPQYSWTDPAYELIHTSIVACHRNLLGHLRGTAPAETTGPDNLKTLQLVFAAYQSQSAAAVVPVVAGRDVLA